MIHRLFYVFAWCLMTSGCAGVTPIASPVSVVLPASVPSQIPTALVPSLPATATRNPPTVAPTPTGTPDSLTKPTAAPATLTSQGENCGEVRMLGSNPPSDATALQAENCFWQAYQQCQIATLGVVIAGVDTGNRILFVVQKNSNSCGIVHSSEKYMVPRGVINTITAPCSGLIRQNGELLFQACGSSGDIALPAPQTK